MFIVSLWYHGWEKNAMESEENFPKSCGSRQIDEREKSCYDFCKKVVIEAYYDTRTVIF